jgi:hypothetical protein
MVQGPSAEDPFLSVNMQLYTRFLGSFSVNSSIFLLYNWTLKDSPCGEKLSAVDVWEIICFFLSDFAL